LDISCIVLAGGKGLRLGRKKTLETINNATLLQTVVSQLAFLNSDTIIVTANEESFPRLTGSKLRVVTDIYPGKGPLAAIYTGLKISDSFYNLVVACDMPFLNRDLLRYMVQVAPDYDIVVPRVGDMVEPLHAIYSKECLVPIETLIKQDSLSVNHLFALVRTRYVETEEIDRFDPRHLSFFNINTQDDLRKARKLAGET
jgi:molybdopterin-guanine dinucleotide biosynthesis protein A